MSTTITNIDDQTLIEHISSARQRIVFVAPGVSKEVADSIHQAWWRLGVDAVQVLLDLDPEVCRLGYGTIEGIKILQEAAEAKKTHIMHQAGLRIGLLISDQTIFLFSPTPLLIEAGSNTPEHPNAIKLGDSQMEKTTDISLLDALNQNDAKPIDNEMINKVEADLKENPPAKFDLARRVRVFNSRYQFVELTMTGCFLSRKKVHIPSNLVGLAKNKEVESQFHAQFNLVNNMKLEIEVTENNKVRIISEKTLQKKRQEIVRDFLIPLKGYGMVVLKANKTALEKATEELRKDVNKFQEGIKSSLEKHIKNNAEVLVEALLPAVLNNPPPYYTKTHGTGNKEHIRKCLEEDIGWAFRDSDSLMSEMTVTLVFKEISYESLNDKSFIDIAREAMPGVDFLHEEYDATKAENTAV